MRIYRFDRGSNPVLVTGPADLAVAQEGHDIRIVGTPGPNDAGRWAAAIGMAALRGATIQKGQTA